MSSKSQYKKDEKPRFSFKKFIFGIIFFPNFVSGKYSRYNVGLREMSNTFKDEYAEKLWKRYVRNINMLIRAPLSIGILVSLLLFYFSLDKIKRDFKNSKSPIEFQIKRNFMTPSKWLHYNPSNIKVNLWIFLPVAAGYSLSFAGAVFLSLNLGLKKDKEIKVALSQNKYLDPEGEPWDLVWTPLGILFYGYNFDPAAFQKNTRFWNSINFTPDDPKQSPKDANIIYVKLAYDLPNLIGLNLAPLVNTASQSKKIVDLNPDPNIVEIDVKTLGVDPEEIVNDYTLDNEAAIAAVDKKREELIAKIEPKEAVLPPNPQSYADAFLELSDKPFSEEQLKNIEEGRILAKAPSLAKGIFANALKMKGELEPLPEGENEEPEIGPIFKKE